MASFLDGLTVFLFAVLPCSLALLGMISYFISELKG